MLAMGRNGRDQGRGMREKAAVSRFSIPDPSSLVPDSSPASIGVFDSGVGGLTVFREIARALPHQSLIYLGDSARVPYGTKSAETVTRFSLQAASFLLDRGIGMLVV